MPRGITQEEDVAQEFAFIEPAVADLLFIQLLDQAGVLHPDGDEFLFRLSPFPLSLPLILSGPMTRLLTCPSARCCLNLL